MIDVRQRMPTSRVGFVLPNTHRRCQPKQIFIYLEFLVREAQVGNRAMVMGRCIWPPCCRSRWFRASCSW